MTGPVRSPGLAGAVRCTMGGLRSARVAACRVSTTLGERISMAPSPPDPDEPDWEWDTGPVWEPDEPWEPEPETSPWSEHEASRGDDDGPWGAPDWQAEIGPGQRPSPPSPPVGPRVHGRGPAYLAAGALLTVLFALGLLTVGLEGRGRWSQVVLGVGSGLFLFGLAMLGLAVWLVGGLERG